MTSSEIKVEQLGVALGAEVHGVDLRKSFASEEMEFLRDALAQHQVLVFRGQGDLAVEHHLKAAAIWGVPGATEPYRTLSLLDGTACDIPSVQKRGPGMPPYTDLWHADVTYSPSPPLVGTLYAELVPKLGGDTAFVSLRSVYNALSQPFKDMCSRLQGEHSIEPMKSAGFPLDDRIRKLFPPTLHPLVLSHPRTGDKAIYIGGAGTWMQRIVGLNGGEATAMIDYLRSQLDNLEHQFRWRWSVGDLLVWDQRSVNHMGMSDHYATDPHRIVRSIWSYEDDKPAGTG